MVGGKGAFAFCNMFLSLRWGDTRAVRSLDLCPSAPTTVAISLTRSLAANLSSGQYQGGVHCLVFSPMSLHVDLETRQRHYELLAQVEEAEDTVSRSSNATAARFTKKKKPKRVCTHCGKSLSTIGATRAQEWGKSRGLALSTHAQGVLEGDAAAEITQQVL